MSPSIQSSTSDAKALQQLGKAKKSGHPDQHQNHGLPDIRLPMLHVGDYRPAHIGAQEQCAQRVGERNQKGPRWRRTGPLAISSRPSGDPASSALVAHWHLSRMLC